MCKFCIYKSKGLDSIFGKVLFSEAANVVPLPSRFK